MKVSAGTIGLYVLGIAFIAIGLWLNNHYSAQFLETSQSTIRKELKESLAVTPGDVLQKLLEVEAKIAQADLKHRIEATEIRLEELEKAVFGTKNDEN